MHVFMNDKIIFSKQPIFKEKNIGDDQNSVTFTRKKSVCKNGYLFNRRRSLSVSMN
ncbi:hypothetical protein ALT721_200004 [Alteromonas alvinellae]